MKCTFPPHTQSPVLCSQQVPVRFFRSENKFCCLSVCARRYPPELYFCRNPRVFCRQRQFGEQVYLLESELVISSESFRAQPILQDLSPSSKGAFLPETCRGMNLVSVGTFSWANMAFLHRVHPLRGIRPHSIYSVTLFNFSFKDPSFWKSSILIDEVRKQRVRGWPRVT